MNRYPLNFSFTGDLDAHEVEYQIDHDEIVVTDCHALCVWARLWWEAYYENNA